MNLLTQVAQHSAEDLLDVRPLHAALAAMRAELDNDAPHSLPLFRLFEPWVLEWAPSPNSPTARAWLEERWKFFVFWRIDELLTLLEMHYRKRDANQGLSLAEGAPKLRAIAGAYLEQFAGKHPLLVKGVRLVGSLGFYVFLGFLFLACQVMGLDVGDRLQAIWRQ